MAEGTSRWILGIAVVAVAALLPGCTTTPDGSYVYVAIYGNSSTQVISTATNTVVATIPGGSGPYLLDVMQ